VMPVRAAAVVTVAGTELKGMLGGATSAGVDTDEQVGQGRLGGVAGMMTSPSCSGADGRTVDGQGVL
jgi:hypothetical protein